MDNPELDYTEQPQLEVVKEPDFFSVAYFDYVIPVNEKTLVELRQQIDGLEAQWRELNGAVKLMRVQREMAAQKEAAT